MRYWLIALLAATGCGGESTCDKACRGTTGEERATCLDYCARCIVGNDPRCDSGLEARR